MNTLYKAYSIKKIKTRITLNHRHSEGILKESYRLAANKILLEFSEFLQNDLFGWV